MCMIHSDVHDAHVWDMMMTSYVWISHIENDKIHGDAIHYMTILVDYQLHVCATP